MITAKEARNRSRMVPETRRKEWLLSIDDSIKIAASKGLFFIEINAHSFNLTPSEQKSFTDHGYEVTLNKDKGVQTISWAEKEPVIKSFSVEEVQRIRKIAGGYSFNCPVGTETLFDSRREYARLFFKSSPHARADIYATIQLCDSGLKDFFCL